MSGKLSLPVEELYATTTLTFTFGIHTCTLGAFIYWVQHQPKVPKFLLVTGLLGFVCVFTVTAVSNVTLSMPQERNKLIDGIMGRLRFVALTNADVVQVWRCSILCWRQRPGIMVPIYVLLAISLSSGLATQIYEVYLAAVLSYSVVAETGLQRYPLRTALQSTWLLSSGLSTIVATYRMLSRIGDLDKNRSDVPPHSRLHNFLVHVLRDGSILSLTVQTVWSIADVCEITMSGPEGSSRTEVNILMAYTMLPVLLGILGMFPIYVTLLAAFGRHILIKDGVIPVTIVLPSTHFDVRESVVLDPTAEYPWREGFGCRPVQDRKASNTVASSVPRSQQGPCPTIADKTIGDATQTTDKNAGARGVKFMGTFSSHSASASYCSDSSSVI